MRGVPLGGHQFFRRVPAGRPDTRVKLVDEEVVRHIPRRPGTEPPPDVVICRLILKVKVQIVRAGVPELHFNLHRIAETVLIRNKPFVIVHVDIIVLKFLRYIYIELDLI